MRVAVTRPEHSGRLTAERLAALGHTPVMLPLMAPQHKPKEAKQALVSPHSGLIVTSAEALHVLAALDEIPAASLNAPLYAVGTATAKAASGIGFRNVIHSEGTGNSLAERIAGAHGSDTNQPPLLYLAGKPRAPYLERSLKEKEIGFTLSVCYEMAPVAYDETELRTALLSPLPDAILLYSRETARIFFSFPLVSREIDAFRNVRFLCLSTNVADAVPDQFRATISIAAAPSETALLALL